MAACLQPARATARLLVGALPNEDHYSAKSYQDFLARNSYADYKITNRPLGDDWLVLSGEADGKIFYEKAIFSCGGQLITSFAMLYPADKREVFDPIVARVANSFVPGTKTCRAAPSSASAHQGVRRKLTRKEVPKGTPKANAATPTSLTGSPGNAAQTSSSSCAAPRLLTTTSTFVAMPRARAADGFVWRAAARPERARLLGAIAIAMSCGGLGVVVGRWSAQVARIRGPGRRP